MQYVACKSITSWSPSVYTASMLWVNRNSSTISSLCHSATNPLVFWAVLYSPWFRFITGMKKHTSRNFLSASKMRLISLVRLQNSQLTVDYNKLEMAERGSCVLFSLGCLKPLVYQFDAHLSQDIPTRGRSMSVAFSICKKTPKSMVTAVAP